jgi:hypothetical protein
MWEKVAKVLDKWQKVGYNGWQVWFPASLTNQRIPEAERV